MKPCNTTDSGRFLAGEMSAVEISSFEDHLEICAECRQRLELDSGDTQYWEAARELLPYSPPKYAASTSTTDSDWLPECTTAQVLSFVAPSDDPSMVGRVGQYEICGLLGRGSAGIVLKGFDRALNRNVAIKVLDPAMVGVGAARQRFAREARAMAAISHEHLVPVFEVNEHCGLPYFVMEYVPGGSLERRLRTEGTLDVLSCVRIGLQTALALSAAHGQGLIHRDIKPGNILLDRGTERVRVADFGLVRVANDVSCSRSGVVAGTPQYMAPEQVRAELCDAQSDLFSLGAVLYALCTGHPPFRADTIYGVMQRIVHSTPRSIREQNSAVPCWLEAFILRLLSKDRAARFASADEVAGILSKELACLQNPEQVSAPRREWLPQALTKARQKRATWVAGGVAAIGLMTAMFLYQTAMPTVSFTPPQTDTTPVLASPSPKTIHILSEGELSTLLWNGDGTAELKQAIGKVESAWHERDIGTGGQWSSQTQEIGQKLDELLAVDAVNLQAEWLRLITAEDSSINAHMGFTNGVFVSIEFEVASAVFVPSPAPGREKTRAIELTPKTNGTSQRLFKVILQGEAVSKLESLELIEVNDATDPLRKLSRRRLRVIGEIESQPSANDGTEEFVLYVADSEHFQLFNSHSPTPKSR